MIEVLRRMQILQSRHATRLGLTAALLAVAGCGGPASDYGTIDLTASKAAAEAKGISKGNDPEKASRKKQGSPVPGQPVGKRAGR